MIDEALKALDARQCEAIDHPSNPLCIIAKAGSGKTLVLARRIARRAASGDLDVRRTLAITFTTKAAGELRDRLTHLLGRDIPTTATFHAIARRMLVDHAAQHQRPVPNVLDNPHEFLLRGLSVQDRRHSNALLVEFAWAQSHGIAPPSYVASAQRAQRAPDLDLSHIADVYDSYCTRKRQQDVLDFDDLLAESVRLLRDDPVFARAQHWRFRHFFVDEYQDTNPLQQAFLDGLLAGRDDLCVVGDVNQAIYGFNGADPTFLVDFSARHPNAHTIELTRNYRSNKTVVDFANAALQGNQARLIEAPVLHKCDDEDSEARLIARHLRAEHLPGTHWRSQAVLARTQMQLTTIEHALDTAGIPHRRQHEQTDTDAVIFCTFHAAKGLEWPIVHLAGLEEGYVPHFRAQSDEALEEERRLLYVALSRPRRRLYLTWAATRGFGETRVQRLPSRWVAAIAAQPVPTRRTPSKVVARRQEATHDLAARLHHWRSVQARAARVPVNVVLPDNVLSDLVRICPSTVEELAAIDGLGPSMLRRFGSDIIETIGANT